MRKYLDGDILAIREAMRITFVEVGSGFARHEFKKIINAKALGDVNDSFDSQLANYANTEMSTISTNIGDTLKDKATKILNDPDLSEAQKSDLIDDLISSRAKIVSDNEVTRASNIGLGIGATAAILASQDTFVKTWVSTIDDRIRDGHDRADGQTVRSNEAFIVAGEALQAPLDPNGSVGNTINCRCTVVYHKVKPK